MRSNKFFNLDSGAKGGEMAQKIIMPKLGMSMTEGKVIEWLVEEGERVEEGQIILRIESDKIEYEIEAPCAGTFAKILVMPSEEPIPVGQTLALILRDGETLSEEDLVSEPLQQDISYPEKELSLKEAEITTDLALGDRVKASPAAKKLAQEKGIDLTAVKGSGPGGRITRQDVETFCQTLAPKEMVKVAEARPEDHLVLGATKPLSRRRKTIAQRLTASYSTIPHIYLFTEVDTSALKALRTKLLPSIQEETGKELSYNDLLVKTVALAIEQSLLFNATLEGDTIRIGPTINIGFAVAAPEGLIVPVIKAVEQKSLSEIVIERAQLVQRALDNKLELTDIEGGTFTISNLGMYGVDYFTALINPPQTGILSVGKIIDKPWVVKGEITIRPIMTLGLSADHRLIDGAVGASFLHDIKTKLENPPFFC
jgi:pyruvate dehydrogenase E2 component (dihydrolipoamide acetyltransferase)